MVVTRFAPSPTGSMHVGNARTAIFNYLFARHNNGKLILRIEDTDLERSTRENEEKLIEDLKWLGIEWDEGPFRQSERMSIYKEYAEKLVKEGKAFYCFCTDEELERKKIEAEAKGIPPHYDGTCRKLTDEEVRIKLENKIPYTIRFKVEPGDIEFDDLIKGNIVMKEGMFGDFVILRSNGMPVYNFAVVVDDALMGVTHVIRAEEHLSNTARQILIYRALGFNTPYFSHTPLILANDGSKLSKRHGATSVAEYRQKGYLPEALFNYLALLGFTPESGKEKLSKDEIIKEFDIKRISKSPSKFDINKLNWLNSEYIKEIDRDVLLKKLKLFLDKSYFCNYDKNTLDRILILSSGGIQYFEQINDNVKIFFDDSFNLSDEYLKNNQSLIKLFYNKVSSINNINKDMWKEIVKEIGKELSLKGKELFMPVRVITTGQEHGPDIYEVLDILGKDRVLKRVERFIR
ncbi:MAG TPA: glutamate--tRNA ligase [Spirochaetota bacterium]|nr:glutamate--tRNA ligase [Spirochaetota bacterium]